MKRISFNKGKVFYDITNIKDREFVISKLNEKTWNALVEKMDCNILMKGLNSNTTFVKPDNLNSKEGRFYMLSCYLNSAQADLVI